jgi:hypothetical protein
MGVDGKLSDSKEFIPVGMLRVDIVPKHLFRLPICTLSLPTCLRVKGSGDIELGAKKGEKRSPKLRM